MKVTELAKKKVLLTQFALRYFAGSEIVILELADFLKQAGAEVTVFAWYLGEPLKSEFQRRGIYVTTDDFDPVIMETDFDYAWINHQVLPMGLLNRMQAAVQGIVPARPLYQDPRGDTVQVGKLPYFIFYHMSALPDNSLEHPYAFNLEKYFAGQSLFVSEEALKFERENFGDIFNNVRILPNMFPEEFLVEKIQPRLRMRKVLTVSNHPPEELMQVLELLARRGVQADAIGKKSQAYKLATPDLLKEYDAVITIGKTVQYCFALGVPVYIYDRFGGCGYLGEDNFEKAYYANFSGRGFSRKTAEMIADEIVGGFTAAEDFMTRQHEDLVATFQLKQNVARVIRELPEYTPRKDLTDVDFNLIALAEAVARKKICAENALANYVAKYGEM